MANLESTMWNIILVEVILMLGVCIAWQFTKREKEKKKTRKLLVGKLDEWATIYEETGSLPSQTDSVVLLKLWADFCNFEIEL